MEILTTLSAIDQTPKQEVSTAIEDSNNMINYYDLIDIYITNHPIIAKYTFLLTTHRILSRRTACSKVKQVLIHFRSLQSYQVCFDHIELN